MISISFLFLVILNFVTKLNGELEIQMNQSLTFFNATITASEIMNHSFDQISTKQEHIVEYILLPFIFIVGTVCNFLTFLVMRRKKMRHQSTYFYMAVLAVADEIVLIVGCLNYWFYLFMRINVTILSDYSCKIACVLLYGMFHFCVWVVVIMTIERFIAVALPLQANHLCTVKRAKIYTLALAGIIFLINIHFLFSHSVFKRSDSEELGCQPNKNYEFLMHKIWPWIDASTYSFIPLTLLIIFNILIVHNLIKASKSIEKLNSNNPKSNINNKSVPNSKRSFYLFSFICLGCCCSNQNDKVNKKIIKSKSLNQYDSKFLKFNRDPNSLVSKSNTMYHQNLLSPNTNQTVVSSTNNLSSVSSTSSANRRLTIMLLVISMTFFITSTPIVTLQTIEQAGIISQSRALAITRGVFIVLQYLNHSINFFLYAVTGKTFRREFFALFKSNSKKQISSKYTSKPNYNISYNTSLSKNSFYNQYSINQSTRNCNQKDNYFSKRKSDEIQV